MDLSPYLDKVVAQDQEGAALLNAICVPTLRNVEDFVEVLDSEMGGLKVVRIPEGHRALAFSVPGLDYKRPDWHTASMVDYLAWIAAEAGAKPLVLADVVDSNSGDIGLIDLVGKVMAERADYHRFGIINGENAILGARVNPNVQANVCGTLLCMYEERMKELVNERLSLLGIQYFDFDPKGRAIYLNCDGIGTKPEFYERLRRFPGALYDSLAMKVDDASKVGAEVIAVFDMLEHRGSIPTRAFEEEACYVTRTMGFPYYVVPHRADSRWMGYTRKAPAFNLSGTAISLIDEERLRNSLHPKAGDYLIAIRGNPTPRSNGISAKRKAMVEMLGPRYHLSDEGKKYLGFLAEPSTVFYPVFKQLIDGGLASWVTHMSGGAFDSKLAKPLAKHGLYAELSRIYEPDPREVALCGDTPVQAVYGMFPMGNEAFIASDKPASALALIRSKGLDAKVVSILKSTEDGKTGVLFRAHNGEPVYFSGTKAA
ncbi:hypothetical protein JW968_00440 [Candidatus Woesearchaeota archaeon]|nr:hypothetical protein [Candidatus Woesearchaeota archaeon]